MSDEPTSWVSWFEENNAIKDVCSTGAIKESARFSAMQLGWKYGYIHYTVDVSDTSLFFSYHKGDKVFTALIPLHIVQCDMTAKPAMESVILMHQAELAKKKQ